MGGDNLDSTDQGTTHPTGREGGDDAIPEKLGKYELRGEIGRGACGVVYKGFDPFVERDVAIKISLGDDDSAHGSRNFFAEARAAGMLQHPHIVALYDAGVEDELSYIVMESSTVKRCCRCVARKAPGHRWIRSSTSSTSAPGRWNSRTPRVYCTATSSPAT